MLSAEGDHLYHGSFPPSFIIKIVVQKHVVLIIQIINLIRVNFKYGRHYAGKPWQESPKENPRGNYNPIIIKVS